MQSERGRGLRSLRAVSVEGAIDMGASSSEARRSCGTGLARLPPSKLGSGFMGAMNYSSG